MNTPYKHIYYIQFYFNHINILYLSFCVKFIHITVIKSLPHLQLN